MSHSESLLNYIRKARAAGAEVELVASEDLPARLASLLHERDTVRTERSLVANPKFQASQTGTAVSNDTTPVAAVPASGWPEGLRQVVVSALEAAGFRIETPALGADGFSWQLEGLSRAVLGITCCGAFLAETGSMVIEAGPGRGTLASLLPEIHLALSYPEDCRDGLGDYLAGLAGALPSRFTLITGPSRTGDIELTMTTGAHGPRRTLHWIISPELAGSAPCASS